MGGVELAQGVDEDVLQVQQKLDLLQSRYDRHTRYLRQRIGSQGTELGALHARNAAQDVAVQRLTSELAAMRKQLSDLQRHLARMSTRVPRSLMKPTRAPRVLYVKAPPPVVPVGLGDAPSSPRPSMAPFLWAAAGLGAATLLLPRHRKTLLVLAGSIVLVGAVRWVRGGR